MYVTRYVIKDTVEEVCSTVTLAVSQFCIDHTQEMRSQQQWKKQLAALGFDEMPDVIDDGESSDRFYGGRAGVPGLTAA